MKNIIKLSLLSFLLLQSFAFAENSGGCGGHGGDGYSLEFYRLGKNLAAEFSSWPKSDFANLQVKFSPSEFNSAVENTRIVSTKDSLILNEREVDAINHSDLNPATIEINRARWDAYQNNRLRKIGIVLHEYLGIVEGLYHRGEWDNYQLSSELMALYEKKYINSQQTFNNKLALIKDQFSKTSALSLDQFKLDASWSCTEYSAIKNDISKFAHENAYLYQSSSNGSSNYGEWHTNINFDQHLNSWFRQWLDVDPTESIDRPASVMQEFIRINTKGDLIVELTTDYLYQNQVASSADPKRGVLSYFYCSRLGSQGLKMMRFMEESLLPILNTTETQGYKDYVAKIKRLKRGFAFRRCEATNYANESACLKFLRKLDQIKLPVEREIVERAKNNINVINNWLHSLSDQDNAYVSKPLMDLYAKYVVHQKYIMSISDAGILPHNGDSTSMRNFVDSLTNRLPLAYKEAKQSFIQEYEEAKRSWLLEFAP